LRALVLGGGGFIGSHLAAALIADRHFVRVLERPYRDRTTAPAVDARLEWREGDFGNAQDVGRALEGIDTVFHLISTTQPQSSNDDPAFDVQSNLLPTLSLLDQLRERPGVRLIFVSSGGTVYGVPQQTPIPETHPTDPTCSYGIVKLAIEKYLALYRVLHGLDYSILRLANPYGPGQEANRAQGVVGTFLYRVTHGEAIEVWGDGSVVRDYVYIGDAVSSLLRAAEYRGDARIFNIGSGTGHSVREILDAVEAVTGRKADVRYTPARKFDVPVSILDISRARAELGWTPAIDLAEGLRLTHTAVTGK
jgi:UDP-glucose 4-epimerase